MEPRPFGRGTLDKVVKFIQHPDALQWSHGRRAVEPMEGVLGQTNPLILQWSHGRSGVEHLREPRGVFHGPSAVEHAIFLPLLVISYTLQWSHGPSAVEHWQPSSGRAGR